MSTIVAFNNDTLDLNVRPSIQQRADRIRSLMAHTAKNIIDAGLHLAAARDELPRLVFEAWCRAEFQLPPSTVRRYMQIARHFAGLPAETVERCQPTALFYLAGNKTTPKQIREALSIAESGALLTTEKAKAIVRRNRPSPRGTSSGRHVEASNVQHDVQPETSNLKPTRYVLGVVVNRELSGREARLLRSVIDNALYSELGAGCRVETLDPAGDA